MGVGEPVREDLTATKLKPTEVADAYGFSKSVVTDYLKLLDSRVKKNLLTEEEFKGLKEGKYSAKKVSRMIDALENGKSLADVLASKNPAQERKAQPGAAEGSEPWKRRHPRCRGDLRILARTGDGRHARRARERGTALHR